MLLSGQFYLVITHLMAYVVRISIDSINFRRYILGVSNGEQHGGRISIDFITKPAPNKDSLYAGRYHPFQTAELNIPCSAPDKPPCFHSRRKRHAYEQGSNSHSLATERSALGRR